MAGPAAAEGPPSGQALVLWQVLWERVDGGGTQAVMRFIAPDLAATGYDAAARDMDWLCETHALPIAGLPAARSDEVVINLLDRPVTRGVTDPDAAQFFQTYDVDAGGCTLQGF